MKRGIEHNTHPGELLKEDIVQANGLTILKAAELPGITRPSLSDILNEKTSITPNMSLRIAKVFGDDNDLEKLDFIGLGKTDGYILRDKRASYYFPVVRFNMPQALSYSLVSY